MTDRFSLSELCGLLADLMESGCLWKPTPFPGR